MLTVVAWILFVWMTGWNVLFWTVGVLAIVNGEHIDWQRTRVEMAISLTLWFIPGVYLFGLN